VRETLGVVSLYRAGRDWWMNKKEQTESKLWIFWSLYSTERGSISVRCNFAPRSMPTYVHESSLLGSCIYAACDSPPTLRYRSNIKSTTAGPLQLPYQVQATGLYVVVQQVIVPSQPAPSLPVTARQLFPVQPWNLTCARLRLWSTQSSTIPGTPGLERHPSSVLTR
jgi:hypothetical protein